MKPTTIQDIAEKCKYISWGQFHSFQCETHTTYCWTQETHWVTNWRANNIKNNNNKFETYYIDCKMRGWVGEGVMHCLKIILTTSEYLHVQCMYIHSKKWPGWESEGQFSGGGGGEGERQGVALLIMLVKTLSLFWESNSRSEEGWGAYQIF